MCKGLKRRCHELECEIHLVISFTLFFTCDIACGLKVTFFFFLIWINCVLAYGIFKEWEGTGINVKVFDWSKWNKCLIFVYIA